MKFLSIGVICISICTILSCKKITTTTAGNLIFKFKFDSTQERLNNFGVAAPMTAGHAGQSPRFNKMSTHYVELAPNQYTALGTGSILYKAPETTAGGTNAIDFSKATFAGDNEQFLKIPTASIQAGTYNWLRVSLAYQNYNVYVNGNYGGLNYTSDVTVASFIGFNTYLTNFKIKDSSVTVNANKAQGFWATEGQYLGYGIVKTGQAQSGATTVPNPLFASSPIPAGSCVVTGQFAKPLIITGKETSDIVITVSLSTNKSFEWIDLNGNGKFEPATSTGIPYETVVDMGIRGLIPSY